jgi:hypothetical protein
VMVGADMMGSKGGGKEIFARDLINHFRGSKIVSFYVIPGSLVLHVIARQTQTVPSLPTSQNILSESARRLFASSRVALR